MFIVAPQPLNEIYGHDGKWRKVQVTSQRLFRSVAIVMQSTEDMIYCNTFPLKNLPSPRIRAGDRALSGDPQALLLCPHWKLGGEKQLYFICLKRFALDFFEPQFKARRR